MFRRKQRSASQSATNNYHDQPRSAPGAFVPPEYQQVHATAVQPTEPTVNRSGRQLVLYGTLSLAVMLGAGVGTFVSLSGGPLVAAPLVAVEAPDGSQDVLEYGPNELYSHGSFYVDTLNSFIDQDLTFITANLSTMEITYFENGEEILRLPIASKGKEGSWWETPAGLYDISLKKPDHFSSFGQVHQPYSMIFQGNFFIHGWPEYSDGTPVPDGYSGGCIRLATEDAKKLYEKVSLHTPVLVYEEEFAGDDFVYEEALPDIDAKEYLIADISNNTILAASDMDAVLPIASLAKLMTAVVAAEYIDLDKRVRVTQEKYVTTLIPRLRGYGTTSMYSLLQLLLVESSNEAAEVIASQLGRERFISLMNKKAESLGLSNTVFADPAGLEDENQSSVSDLFQLAQYIYHNRNFIFELTVDQDLPTAYSGGDFGELNNFNQMDEMPSFLGGKIGETAAAGQTNLSLHELQINGEKRVLVVVVLGSGDRTEAVKSLLQYVQNRYGR